MKTIQIKKAETAVSAFGISFGASVFIQRRLFQI